MTFKLSNQDRVELTLWGAVPTEFSELDGSLHSIKERVSKMAYNTNTSGIRLGPIQHPFFRPKYLPRANRLIYDWTPQTITSANIKTVNPIFGGFSALVEIESNGERFGYFEPNYSKEEYDKALRNPNTDIRIGAINVGLSFLVSSQDDIITKATNEPIIPNELPIREDVFEVRNLIKKSYFQRHNYQMALAKSILNDQEEMQLVFCNNPKAELNKDKDFFVKTRYFLLGKLD